jgi:hypothetical protein
MTIPNREGTSIGHLETHWAALWAESYEPSPLPKQMRIVIPIKDKYNKIITFSI